MRDTESSDEPSGPEESGPARMAKQAEAQKRSYESVLQAAGAVAGFGLVVALLGGAVVWERLHTLHLAANPITEELPRSLFLVVGARVLAFPVVLAAAAVFIAWISQQAPMRGWLRSHRSAVLTAAAVVVAAALVNVAVVVITYYIHHHRTYILIEQSLFIAAAVVAAVVATVQFDRKLTARWFAWTFVLVGSFCAIVEVIDIALPPVKLEFARVELVGGGTRRGFFVGQNSARVYIAPATHGCAVLGRIVAIPQSHVRLLSVASSRNAYRSHTHCRNQPNSVLP